MALPLPQVAEVVKRRFADEGDVALVTEFVTKSDGVRRTQAWPVVTCL